MLVVCKHFHNFTSHTYTNTQKTGGTQVVRVSETEQKNTQNEQRDTSLSETLKKAHNR